MTERDTSVPTVSIILPTYNRARFLPEAFASIRAQSFSDWELIVVDDGSSDETCDLIPKLAGDIEQHVRYVNQENRGAYGARNTGLGHAQGTYIAFYDSDDRWLPHHLKDCVEGLEADDGVDWIYGACRIVNLETGETLDRNTFYLREGPRPFMRLDSRHVGRMRVVSDRSVIRCMILHGLYNGLQNSVIRSRLFRGVRFESASRNEAEDQLFVIRMLARGHQLAYLDNVHVEYRVHAENSSGSASGSQLEKRLRVQKTLIDGYERLPADVELSASERRALRRRLSREYFWLLGYALLWQHGRHAEALEEFRRGLAYEPWNLAFLKTYSLARVKVALRSLMRSQ
jgi:glycosyltransferase involved in cell wall biosynthesis